MIFLSSSIKVCYSSVETIFLFSDNDDNHDEDDDKIARLLKTRKSKSLANQFV